MQGLLERNIGIQKYFSYVVIKSVSCRTHHLLERIFAAREQGA